MLNTLSGAVSKLLQEVQCVGVGGGVWVCMGGGGNVTRGAVWVNMSCYSTRAVLKACI